MDKKGIIDTIKTEKAFLKERFGVDEIALFGSFARDEGKADSDVDILVTTRIKNLVNYFSLLDYLESKFHKKIDLVTKHSGLSERFLRMISKDIIYV
ncbi:MAG: nucleotidyltransferase domain-containing protein [bacterium]|nr:nucleotidyltransferase domain-containing protein [bacterium]